jgi:uncharacterized protein (DUF1697 family)
LARYAAFLRGINVGGRTLKMAPLKKALQDAGFQEVQTLLASGNVVFTAHGSPAALRSKVEGVIRDEFKMDVHVVLRSAKQLRDLAASDPFKGVKVTPKTRLFITFLSTPTKPRIKTPFKDAEGDYVIRAVTPDHVVSVLTLTKTPDAMDILVKEFGKDITTRNWNTVHKVIGAL